MEENLSLLQRMVKLINGNMREETTSLCCSARLPLWPRKRQLTLPVRNLSTKLRLCVTNSCEDARQSIRMARQNAMDMAKKLYSHAPKDDVKKLEKEASKELSD
ncbi:hypothetical protein ACJW31_01G114800 [Castanea mollissima]